jgi:signal transduction histidine kinase
MEDAEDSGRENDVADLQKIRAAGKHLVALINDVLDLSKIEAGKMEVHLETVSPMLQDVVSTIAPLVSKNDNRLETRCTGDLGTIVADLTKVRQALFNLLSNASKFTGRGTITRHHHTGGHAPANGLGSVSVSKIPGIGMAPEQMANSSRPFRKLRSRPRRTTAVPGWSWS